MKREIVNRDAIVEQLTELLMKFDKECNQYQTDVYLCFDRDTNTATLDTFVNVGGNSWLNDDHYTIYCDREHHEDWSNHYCNNGDFAWGLDMSVEDFNKEVFDFLDLDDDERADYDIEWCDKYEYVKSRHDYCEKLIAVYEDYIDEQRAEYAERAEEIFDRVEKIILDCERKKDENDDYYDDYYSRSFFGYGR